MTEKQKVSQIAPLSPSYLLENFAPYTACVTYQGGGMYDESVTVRIGKI